MRNFVHAQALCGVHAQADETAPLRIFREIFGHISDPNHVVDISDMIAI